MSLTVNQLRDFSSLFSRSEVFKWLKDDFESIDIKLNRYNLTTKTQGKPYLSILKTHTKTLKRIIRTNTF